MTDHQKLLLLIIRGIARWEPFASNPNSGEVCFGGIRYSTNLDANGLPEIKGVLLRDIETRIWQTDPN